jgi:molybdopterin/thiamine biosynthesis adenylyltransferase
METKAVSSFSSSSKKSSQEVALPGLSARALELISCGSVLIAGVQLSGLVAAKHLVEAGIGKLSLIDEDPKALSSAYKVLDGVSETEIQCRAWKIDGHDAESIFSETDVVIDGLTNWQDKLLVSDVCMQIGKPLVHAGGSGFRYQLYTMRPNRSACLRCAFPMAGIDDVPLHPPEHKTISAVLGMIGAWQAVEAIKLIAKIGASPGNELTKIDWLSGEFETIRGLDPRQDCPDCGRSKR